METLDLSAAPWTTYSILAEIAGQRGQVDEARQWRRKEQEARLTFEAHSQADTSSPKVRQRADPWNDVVAGIVAVCQSGKPDPELDKFLQDMGGKEDWKNLVAVLSRMLSGERELELFDGLDDIDSAIVRRVLKGLLSGRPAAADGQPSAEGGASQPQASPQAEGVTLPQLLELVERAAQGDHELGGKLFPVLQKMASDPNAPVEMRAFGDALVRIMAGVRDPDLSKLPGELASAVQGLLGRLKHS